MNAELARIEQLRAWEPGLLAPSRTPQACHPGQRARRLWDTVRYLRPRQIYHQLRRRLRSSVLLTTTRGSGQVQKLALQPFADRQPTHLAGGVFRFLNRTVDLGTPVDWTAEDLPHLWRYHLHYFDFLEQPGLDAREGERLMRDWMEHHRPQTGAVGWEPYALSLRVVNWIKFLQRRGEFPADLIASLWLQGANLARQIEHHLLGNHLFVNGKALWWLGVTLGEDSWKHCGRQLILEQLAEQFLPDGGHFELSPMYHALLLEDLLDLINLSHANDDQNAADLLRGYAARGLGWLEDLVGTESAGRFPLLNDCADGVARSLATLRDYAARLGVETDHQGRSEEVVNGWRMCNLSGYRLLQRGSMRLLFDTAPLGPDYLPGHAHADMLSLLFDFEGRPIFTDTGVFEYAEGSARSYCRSTAAHNTVTIDDLNQAELWSSFRVARRGRPGPVQVIGPEIHCMHDGFAQQRRGLGHERTIRLEQNGFTVSDELSGPAEHRFVSRFHLAPETPIAERAGHWWIDERLRLTFRGARAHVEWTPYYPEFGQVARRPSLVLTGKFSQRTRIELSCTSSF